MNEWAVAIITGTGVVLNFLVLIIILEIYSERRK